MMQYRSRTDIIQRMLQIAASEPVLRTNMMDEAKLSWPQFKGYFEELVDMGLIEMVKKGSRPLYKTTPKGDEALKKIQTLTTVLMTPANSSKAKGR